MTHIKKRLQRIIACGWHYMIEVEEVHVFDPQQGGFLPASVASHGGTGPYQPYVEHDGHVISN